MANKTIHEQRLVAAAMELFQRWKREPARLPSELTSGELPFVDDDEAAEHVPNVAPAELARQALPNVPFYGFATAVRLAIEDAVIRELVAISESRQRAEWERIASIRARVFDVARAVADALGCAASTQAPEAASHYLCFRGLRIRVSDHQQVPGGGWNEAIGARMGDADVNFLVESGDDPIPSESEIRAKVARALRRRRREEG